MEKNIKKESVSLQDLLKQIEFISRETPNKLALSSDDGEFTYYELVTEANNIAMALSAAGLKPGDRVANMYQPGSKKIVAFLGSLKVGITFLNTDPNLPQNLLEQILQSTKAVAVIGGQDPIYFGLENISHKDAGEQKSFTIKKMMDDSIAYVLLTSGTTGLPKAIPISRSALSNYISHFGNDFYGLGERNLHFNQFWPPNILRVFLCGHTLSIYDIKRRGASKVIDFMIENEINIVTSYTAVFRELRNNQGREIPSLNAIVLVGEQVTRSDITVFESISRLGSKLFASYGSSEYATISRFVFTHGDIFQQSHLPAGRPYPGLDLRVVNTDHEKTLPLVKGEIVLVNAEVPKGYLNNDELSEKNFSYLKSTGDFAYFTGDMGYIDLDGILHCVGREDDHVKIRGNLVNVKEVEYVLKNLGIFNQVAVSSFVGSKNNARLFCCYTADREINQKEVTTAMRQSVPGYMVPSLFQKVESIPTTTSGKVSKRKLEEMFLPQNSISTDGEESRVELIIRNLFEKILEHNGFELDDDFFDIGGDSLAAFNLVAEIESEFGIKLSFEETFLEGASVKNLAQAVSAEINNYESAFLVPLNYSPSAEVIYALPPFNGHLSDYVQLGRGLSTFAQLLGVRVKGLLLEDLDNRPSIQEVAFDAATAIADRSHSKKINIIGFSAGGIIGYETASILVDWGYTINSLVLIDSPSLHWSQRSWFDRVRYTTITAARIVSFARRKVSDIIDKNTSVSDENRKTDYGCVQMQSWRPRKVAIRTPMLFVAEAGPLKNDHLKRWQSLLGRKLDFIHLTGNHTGLRDERIAHDIAMQIITRMSD